MSISGQRGYKGVLDPVGLEPQTAAVCPPLVLGVKPSELLLLSHSSSPFLLLMSESNFKALPE